MKQSSDFRKMEVEENVESIYNGHTADNGHILFIEKGDDLTHQFFEDEFCDRAMEVGR